MRDGQFRESRFPRNRQRVLLGGKCVQRIFPARKHVVRGHSSSILIAFLPVHFFMTTPTLRGQKPKITNDVTRWSETFDMEQMLGNPEITDDNMPLTIQKDILG